MDAPKLPNEIYARRGYDCAYDGVWNDIHAINGQILKPDDEETSYTRTDRANELVAAAYEAAALECERAAYSGEYPQNDAIELGCLRSRDFIRRLTPADAVAALAARDARIRDAALREAAECVEQFAEISAPDDLKAAILALADTGEDG